MKNIIKSTILGLICIIGVLSVIGVIYITMPYSYIIGLTLLILYVCYLLGEQIKD